MLSCLHCVSLVDVLFGLGCLNVLKTYGVKGSYLQIAAQGLPLGRRWLLRASQG